MNPTYYRASLPEQAAHARLQGRHEARICVIGGGFAGLNTALGLTERGVNDVVLLEAKQIGHGASGRNGGFVFGGFSLGEEDLLRELGPQRARALYRGTLDAVELIRKRSGKYAIDCDIVQEGVIWANWFRDPEILRARQRLLAEHYGVEWDWLPHDTLADMLHTERYSDALLERLGFHFHPLKYAAGLARTVAAAGAAVHEHSPATSLDRVGNRWQVRTPDGQVDAEQVVLACGGYLAGLEERVDAGIMPIATYVMVTEPLGDRMDDAMGTRAAVYDTRFAFDYYRPLPDSRLLWGGRISVLDRPPAAIKQLLYRDLMKVFPQLDGVAIESAWSGLMGYARHQMPQIGEIEPGLWLAQAFGGHGVAPTTFAGELVASALAEGDQRWREFSDFGLVSALKPAGLIGAQLSYWWMQARDGWRTLRGH